MLIKKYGPPRGGYPYVVKMTPNLRKLQVLLTGRKWLVEDLALVLETQPNNARSYIDKLSKLVDVVAEREFADSPTYYSIEEE